MRLSRLSNRQLKRLLAKGEVRFGDWRDREDAIKIFDELFKITNSFVDKYNRNKGKLWEAVKGTVLEDKMRELGDRFGKVTWAMDYIQQQLKKMNK